jgi:hypothetical protein
MELPRQARSQVQLGNEENKLSLARGSGYRSEGKMKTVRRTLFFALIAVLFAGTVWLRLHGPFVSPAFFVTIMSSIIGLVIWSIAFVKTEPNLTRVVLMLVLAFLILIILWSVGSSGA